MVSFKLVVSSQVYSVFQVSGRFSIVSGYCISVYSMFQVSDYSLKLAVSSEVYLTFQVSSGVGAVHDL